MRDIAFRAGCEIVEAKDLVSISQEPVAEMRTEEARSSCDQYGPSHYFPLWARPEIPNINPSRASDVTQFVSQPQEDG
jgi:hypothetical protein